MREKTVFITGGAKRIGASMANYFHERNYKVVFHYNKSEERSRKPLTRTKRERGRFLFHYTIRFFFTRIHRIYCE